MKTRYNLFFEQVNGARGTAQHPKSFQRLEKNRALVLDNFLNYKENFSELAELMDLIEDQDQLD